MSVIDLQSFFDMPLKLKDIAAVSSGVTFRSRIEPSAWGNVRIIQMKDLGQDNFVHLDRTLRVDHARAKPSQFVRIGDIIFRSRGQTNTAAMLNEEAKDAIVAAPLFCVRPNTKKVLPAFLLWWINQPISQKYFSSRAKGTGVNMLSKEDLEDLEIILAPLEKQSKIAEFFSLSTKEQLLLEEIKGRKAVYAQGILMQMLSGHHPKASNKKPGFDIDSSIPSQIHRKSKGGYNEK